MSKSTETDVERRASLLDTPFLMGEAIHEELPELRGLCAQIADSLRPLLGFIHGRSQPPHGLGTAVSQAINAFLDVLIDVQQGRGRPALMNARNLFDLLVTVSDLIADPKLEARYVSHRWFIAQLEGKLDFETEHLSGVDRRAELHRRKKLIRDTAVEYSRARNRYGPSFDRGWAPRDLRSRATKAGLSKDYDFFRLASAVLHGTSGGAIGIRRDYNQTTSVFRTGPALSLCPPALLMSVRHFDLLLKRLGKKRGGPATPFIREHLRALLDYWPQYRSFILRLDRDTWPSNPPPKITPVVFFRQPDDEEEWFLWDIPAGLACQATRPIDLPAKTERTIRAGRDRFRRDQELYPRGFCIALAGETAEPRRNAYWQPALMALPLQFGPVHIQDMESL